jgi:NADH dehydrogenase
MASRVLVLGGTGFVGRHVVARLCTAGHEVVVPTRRLDRGKPLLMLPTVDVVQKDVHDEKSLKALVSDCDAVVNLVGILHERGRETFARAHVELARKLVAACRAAGVNRLVHMSALTAAPDAPSRYLRSKGQAQAIVEQSELAWTVFRPSVIFGRGDSFLSLFAKLAKWLPVIALAAPQARFQPVHIGDVAHCFAQSVDDDRTVGQAYDLCGPKAYTLRELVDWVAETSGHVRPIVALGPTLSKLQARVLEIAPGKLMTRDNLASMSVPNVCSAPFPAVFGIEPVALEAIAPEYLAPTAIHSRYEAYRAQSGR